MKLYGSHMAPNSDRVILFLAEKGIEDIPFEAINLMKGEHYAEDYRQMVPNARVPALQLDDGTVIRESVAICRYFEETHPEPLLMGRTPMEKAQVEMYQRLMEMELMMPIAMCFRHGHPAGAALENPQIAQMAEVSRPRAEKRLAVLNKELADREYLAGEFSIADITAFIAVGFGRVARIAPTADQSNIQAWMERMMARPGIKHGLQIIKGAAA